MALVLAAALAVALSGCGGGGAATADGSGRFSLADTLPTGLAGRPAARIRLADARGGTFDTRTLAGSPYLVTFLYVNCPDVCPLIGEELRQALDRLGSQARQVTVVAVSVDPRHDTPAAVRSWLERHREPPQFRYLIGTERELAPIWKAWFAAPQIAGDPESAHTAVVWLVDRRGRLVAKVAAGAPFDPAALASDVRILLRR
ncbi:MAG: SCO family protein [Conexibacter sp.]